MSLPQTLDDVFDRVRALVQDDSFLRLTLMPAAQGQGAGWAKASVRPVLIRGRRMFQFSFWDGRKETSLNAEGAEAGARLDEVLSQPLSHLHCQTTQGDLHVRITRKGKPLVKWGKPSRPEEQPCLDHNRRKDQPLAPGRSDPLLQALGITAGSGGVRSSMRAKFNQINEFLRILDKALPRGAPAGLAVDCGCGAAYLTFAAWRWLRQERDAQARVEGVDANPELIAKCERLRQALRWDGPTFSARAIRDYQPPAPPDVVLSLHACGEATDQALAGAVKWGARVILAAPCCQHELQAQL
ncbi:MAG TPA: SAM-dependent methyltransferase, partial [Candidatus Brocadiia bacterium]|nr:SAM-dependent methyltransferase [Candidatus Brocadiia bacterium]